CRGPRQGALDLAAIVSPVQQRLPLPPAAHQIARLAVFLYLTDMTPYGFPALYLTRVLLRHPAAQIVAAIPLEPAARVVRVKPALALPFRKRLAGINAEEVE